MALHNPVYSNRNLFEYRSVEMKKLVLSLCITLVMMAGEFIGGILTNSMALISDALHMFTHSFAIIIGLVAIIIARKPPCHHNTFGLYRSEILAAFINGLFLLIVVGMIIYNSILRIIQPREILSIQMFLVALLGLLVNLTSIFILRGSEKSDINIKSVFYHLIGDAVSSIGVIIAAVVIYYSGLYIIDPIVSIGISMVIVRWAIGILKESTRILLEMAPSGINTVSLSNDLKSTFPEIKALFNVHLWTITADMLVFSAHIKFSDNADGKKLLAAINKYLLEKYRIIESTIQTFSGDEAETCNIT